MQLPSKAEFRLATLKEVTLQPNEDGGKAVMVISVPLSPSLAEEMGIKEMLYTDKGLSHEFTGAIGLGGDAVAEYQALIKSDVMGDTWFNPEKIRAFKVTRGSEDSDDSDVQLRLEFRLHVTSDIDIDNVYAFFGAVKKGVFDITLQNRQIEMFPKDEKPAGAIASVKEMETATEQ